MPFFYVDCKGSPDEEVVKIPPFETDTAGSGESLPKWLAQCHGESLWQRKKLSPDTITRLFSLDWALISGKGLYFFFFLVKAGKNTNKFKTISFAWISHWESPQPGSWALASLTFVCLDVQALMSWSRWSLGTYSYANPGILLLLNSLCINTWNKFFKKESQAVVNPHT